MNAQLDIEASGRYAIQTPSLEDCRGKWRHMGLSDAAVRRYAKLDAVAATVAGRCVELLGEVRENERVAEYEGLRADCLAEEIDCSYCSDSTDPRVERMRDISLVDHMLLHPHDYTIPTKVGPYTFKLMPPYRKRGGIVGIHGSFFDFQRAKAYCGNLNPKWNHYIDQEVVQHHPKVFEDWLTLMLKPIVPGLH